MLVSFTPTGTMLIDFDTANNLELVRSSLDFSSKNSLYGKPKPAFMAHMAFVLDDRYVSIRGDEQDTHEDGWKAPAVYYTSAGHRQVFVARRVLRRSFCAHAVKEILENRLDVVEGNVEPGKVIPYLSAEVPANLMRHRTSRK